MILLAGLLRGLFWVALTEVPNPIDEAHHLAYIQSLADGRGVPRVDDLVSIDVRRLIKGSVTWGARQLPWQVSKPREWGAAAYQYEGVQPPVYYAAMILPYKLGKLWSFLGALYSVRIASVVLSLFAVPLTWLLARELFPGTPLIWLLSPAILVTVEGFNSNLASVTNDALMLPLTVGALWMVARSCKQPNLRNALWSGAAVGLCLLTKANAAALFPMIALALLILPDKVGFAARVRWFLQATGCAIVVVLPWLAWNMFAYRNLGGGGKIAAELIGQTRVPLNLDGFLLHLGNARSGLWDFQRQMHSGPGPYGLFFEISVVSALVTGLVSGILRRQRSEQRQLFWLGLSWPATFVSMLLIVSVAYTGTIVGRHTYAALVPLVILLAAGLFAAFGSRLGIVFALGLVVVGLGFERAEYRNYLDKVYGPNLVAERGVSPAIFSKEDSKQALFESGFRPSHPGFLTYGFVLVWGQVWFLGGLAAWLAAIVASLRLGPARSPT